MKEKTMTIGSLVVYYIRNKGTVVITYAEQAGVPYILDDEEAREVEEVIQRRREK